MQPRGTASALWTHQLTHFYLSRTYLITVGAVLPLEPPALQAAERKTRKDRNRAKRRRGEDEALAERRRLKAQRRELDRLAQLQAELEERQRQQEEARRRKEVRRHRRAAAFVGWSGPGGGGGPPQQDAQHKARWPACLGAGVDCGRPACRRVGCVEGELQRGA
jgi:hypothetical protein